jgi:inorganic pyrophosphatase
MKTVTAIIETPRGKGQKYDFDPQQGYFFLKKIMPAGMVFPFDFGFIPGTLGEDGDPIDIIVISEIETFAGCAMECRIIGAIKGDQQERDGATMRNDRFLAIPVVSQLYANIDTMAQLPKEIMEQLELFFKNYNEEAGKKFTVLGHSTPKQALKMLEEAEAKQQQKDKLIQIYLPLVGADGKPFPEKFYQTIKEELTEKFGGLTIYSRAPATGLWKENEDKTVRDEILIFEIMAFGLEQAFWTSYKKKLEKKFRQEEILIRCSTITLI